MKKINKVSHYKKLLFFALKRYEGVNYSKMREYFTEVFLYDIHKFIKINHSHKIIDVGGSTGEFSKVIGTKFKCDIVNLDPSDIKPVWKTLKNEAHEIPFEDNYFDLVLFRGVMEHIPPNKQQISLNEIYRVMKKEGIGYFVIPPWYNPHAGHGLKPFHIFPFAIAKFLRNLFFKKKVKYNSLEEASLYKITFSQMKKMINLAGFKIIDMKDTHLRFHFLCKVPILREFLIPAVAFLVKK
jgi:ubiquinone/menaquinone biosynthesis C-methylase UbiE